MNESGVKTSTFIERFLEGANTSKLLETILRNSDTILSETDTEISFLKKRFYFFVVILLILALIALLECVNAGATERSRKKTKQYFNSLHQNGL